MLLCQAFPNFCEQCSSIIETIESVRNTKGSFEGNRVVQEYPPEGNGSRHRVGRSINRTGCFEGRVFKRRRADVAALSLFLILHFPFSSPFPQELCLNTRDASFPLDGGCVRYILENFSRNIIRRIDVFCLPNCAAC